MEEKKELTTRQLIFAKEYARSMNATKAAIKAGYSEKTARTQGSFLLTNVNIQAAIDAELEIISSLHRKAIIAAAGDAIHALVDTIQKGKGLARVQAANSILDRAGHKAVDRIQADVNANVKADVNVNETSAKPTLLSKLLQKFDKGADSASNS